MAEFKTGDIVQLKSGGPKMTVDAVEDQIGYLYVCWFAGSKMEKARVKRDAIQVYVEPPKPAKE